MGGGGGLTISLSAETRFLEAFGGGLSEPLLSAKCLQLRGLELSLKQMIRAFENLQSYNLI